MKQLFARQEWLKDFSLRSVRADAFAHTGPVVVSARKWPGEEISTHFPFASLLL